MKNLIFLAIAVFIFSQCGTKSNEIAPGEYKISVEMGDMESEDKQMAAGFMAMADLRFDFKNDGTVVYKVNMGAISNEETWNYEYRTDSIFFNDKAYKVEANSDGYKIIRKGETLMLKSI